MILITVVHRSKGKGENFKLKISLKSTLEFKNI